MGLLINQTSTSTFCADTRLFVQTGFIVQSRAGVATAVGEILERRAVKQVQLTKGRHYHIFRCDDGCEGDLLQAMVDRVHDKSIDFDWFDASVLSHQLGKQISAELKAFLPKESD